MRRRPGPLAFLAWLTSAIEGATGVTCLADPGDQEAPFFSPQLISTEARDSKTERIERFNVWVHCVAPATDPYSSAGALDLVEVLDAAMEGLDIPALVDIERQGIQDIAEDPETHEAHAVAAYAVDLSCGPICK